MFEIKDLACVPYRSVQYFYEVVKADGKYFPCHPPCSHWSDRMPTISSVYSQAHLVMALTDPLLIAKGSEKQLKDFVNKRGASALQRAPFMFPLNPRQARRINSQFAECNFRRASTSCFITHCVWDPSEEGIMTRSAEIYIQMFHS